MWSCEVTNVHNDNRGNAKSVKSNYNDSTVDSSPSNDNETGDNELYG